MKYFSVFLLSFALLPTHAQHKGAYFYQENAPAHKLYFYADGTFSEFITSHNADTLLSCAIGTNISSGRYYRVNHGYKLTSSEDIQEKNGELQYTFLPCLPLAEDSLYISLRSPYEDLLLSEQHHLCAYKHQRIYRYGIQIKCDETDEGRAFEKQFNKYYQVLDTNVIYCPKPNCVQLKSLSIRIFWRDANGTDYRTEDTVYVNVHRIDSCTNNIHLLLKSFDYFYLSTEKYDQSQFHFTRGNKATLNGRTFIRYIMRTKSRRVATKPTDFKS